MNVEYMAHPTVDKSCQMFDHASSRPRLQKRKKLAQNSRSKGQLEHRSSAVLQFSPWVEAHRQPAIQVASLEEERVKKIIKEKEEKLREFQKEVKKRVKDLEQLKRQEQHGMSVEAFEVERNVLQQSSFPSDKGSVRRDNCTYRDTSELKIQRSVIQDHSAVDAASQLLDEHADKIRNCSKHARSVLSSKSADGEEVYRLSQLLPGGLWRTSHFRDHGTARQECNQGKFEETQPPHSSEGEDYWIGENAIVDDDSCLYNDEYVTGHVQTEGEGTQGKTLSTQPNKRVHFIDSDNEEVETCEFVQYSLPKGDTKEDKKLCRAVETLIQPGKVLEEKKKRAKCQVAVYRRLFMDIEREQVRENIRMKEHRKRMEALKVEKEVERLEVEQQQLDKLKMERVRHEEEVFLAAQRARQNEKELEKRQRKLQKERETERYIEALLAILRERFESQNIVLPPLCSCGTTVWDANPDTCANNCVFYKNPKAYAKALSALLGSSNPA